VVLLAFVLFLKMIAPVLAEAVPKVRVEAADNDRDVPVATPMAGVTSVGVLANTKAPVPVSSEITPRSSAEVVAANTDNLSDVVVSVPVVGSVSEVAPVVVKVSELAPDVIRELPSARVSVAVVAGCVTVTLPTFVIDPWSVESVTYPEAAEPEGLVSTSKMSVRAREVTAVN